MPQHHQPDSLFRLSLNNSIMFISILCKSIEVHFGNYESETCQKHIVILQNYLTSKLPRPILDTIFNAIEDLEPIKDTRVLLSVYMHKNIQQLDNPVNVVNKRLSIKPNTGFWIRELPRLQELVHLNLKLNCTDSILKIVGKYCTKLEFINIISKTESERLKTGNALKIRYLVSDEGLQYLTNCTTLKEIEMNPILRSSFGGKLTIAGICLLVQSLKCLRNISFNYMGEVLTNFKDDYGTLPLLSITDCDAQPDHMTAITRLCPSIHHLTLSCSKNDSMEYGSSTINILAQSLLQLTHLHMEKFDFNNELRNLFKIKGHFIKNLVLKYPGTITSTDIILIGTTCPNINSLRLVDLVLVPTTSWPVFTPILCYSNLESLHLVGKDWSEEAVMDICLSTAFNIQELCLHKNASGDSELLPLDVLLISILKKNPMNNLTTLCICTGRPISMSTVSHFYNNCSELQTFIVKKESISEDEEFLKLCRHIKDNNFNLNLQYL